MPDTLSNIGSTLEVSASAPATEDTTGYGALSWTEVGGVSSIGEIGEVYEVLNQVDLKDGITKKAHGALNYGDPDVQYRIIEADAGQDILKTALTNRTTISFKVTRASGLIQYFQGLVTSNPTSEASSAAVYAKSCAIGITFQVIEDDAGV